MNDFRYRALVGRRWFGVTVAALLMAVAAFLWTFSFEGLALGDHIGSVYTIFLGPFGWGRSPLAWLTGGFPWCPLGAAVGICCHPVYPSTGTLVMTCLGGACWWVMGWWTMASVI